MKSLYNFAEILYFVQHLQMNLNCLPKKERNRLVSSYLSRSFCHRFGSLKSCLAEYHLFSCLFAIAISDNCVFRRVSVCGRLCACVYVVLWFISVFPAVHFQFWNSSKKKRTLLLRNDFFFPLSGFSLSSFRLRHLLSLFRCFVPFFQTVSFPFSLRFFMMMINGTFAMHENNTFCCNTCMFTVCFTRYRLKYIKAGYVFMHE